MSQNKHHPEARQFVKRPVVVWAYQTKDSMDVPTLEGIMHASPGDWIIQGIQGEIYPCKPEIFLATYKEVIKA
ncbi:MAG: hypothetical protein KJ648_06805 [Candidatus Omnitrophica bacterium]|nr:hypothetical protein [Candidatus Omnitrophota bacterium]